MNEEQVNNTDVTEVSTPVESVEKKEEVVPVETSSTFENKEVIPEEKIDKKNISVLGVGLVIAGTLIAAIICLFVSGIL